MITAKECHLMNDVYAIDGFYFQLSEISQINSSQAGVYRHIHTPWPWFNIICIYMYMYVYTSYH